MAMHRLQQAQRQYSDLRQTADHSMDPQEMLTRLRDEVGANRFIAHEKLPQVFFQKQINRCEVFVCLCVCMFVCLFPSGIVRYACIFIYYHMQILF
jgi:hypothetical protein